MGLNVPESFRWKVGRQLGEGGQAPVFLATDKQNELAGEYALKALPSGKPPKAYERFAREIEAIKAVNHPNIVRIIDHSEAADSFQFYVMEYIDGAIPLRKLLNTPNNPFASDPHKSVKFFRQLVSAIHACQEAKVVHRDLSPANVLILPNNGIEIIDFGCCQISDHETITLADEGVGTQYYMAPECESGAEGEIRTNADIYSAGKLLWSAITNRFAFSREDAVFNAKSMKSIFPQQPMTWHLHHIFASTLRRAPNDRISKAIFAVELADRVESLITASKPPLEYFAEKPICPNCGWGRLSLMADDWHLYHNPMPPGYQGWKCDYCGICFPVHGKTIRENIDGMSKLH